MMPMMPQASVKPTMLIVDDSPVNLHLLLESLLFETRIFPAPAGFKHP